MKPVLTACLACCLLALSVPRALASPYPQANAYFQVRDRAAVVTSFSPNDVSAQPEKFAGKLLEVRGHITGMAGSDHIVLLVEGQKGVPGHAVRMPPGETPAGLKFLDVEVRFRGLCKVVRLEGTSTGSLELVTAVQEHEASEVDRAREKKRQEEALKRRAASKTAPKRVASRGMNSGVGRAAGRKYTRAEMVEIYAGAVRHFNRRLNLSDARKISNLILGYSDRYNLDPRLVMAVIAVESNFNAHAVSPVGAMGLGQLMPGTAGDLGVGNAFDPTANLEGSTRLLSSHIRNMSANGRPTDEAVKLALACYNAGAGAVKKYRGIPPYRETQNYVAKITRLYRQMCGYQD